MRSNRFCRYELRARDVARAREFYAAVLGDLELDIVTLPAEVAARGAPPHWLGHIAVDDVEAGVRAFVERGATRLGPTRARPEGGEVAIVRDPGSAVVALTSVPASAAPRAPARAEVAWHVLNSSDLERSLASYRELFGWELGEALDLGPLGVFHPFAWQPGGERVGSMVSIVGRAGVHPHWLFHFEVAALEPALATLRALGGLVVATHELASGERIAVCDDPQGAAFALREAQ